MALLSPPNVPIWGHSARAVRSNTTRRAAGRCGLMFMHLVATPRFGLAPFHHPAHADWLWLRLRETFPDALAACILWNHIHLVSTYVADSASLMGKILGGFARRVGRPGMFHAAPPPRPIPDRKHLQRTVRYVHLNPCREGIVRDPMSWPWSTHRGAIGAEFDPWVAPGRMQRELQWRTRDFPREFHRHVSSDPSAKVDGTPFPAPAQPRINAIVPLDMILAAANSATPWASRALSRKLAHQLAKEQGWADSPQLARALGVSRRTLRRWSEQPKLPAIVYPRLCLGDPRLFSRPAQLTPTVVRAAS